MEYQFTRDLEGRVHVRMSMDHEVIGYWFNEEVKHNLALLDQIEDEAQKLRGTENQWRVVGKEYLLSLTEDEVMIQANSLSFDTNDLEEGMSYYDVESLAFCGLDDFLELIKAYRQFHQEYC